MNGIKCVLFDLDGTLLDTSYDLHYALERTCHKFKVANVPYEEFRQVISAGGEAMIKLAFKNSNIDEIAIRKEYFLQDYFQNIAEYTKIFTGLEQGLQNLADKNIPWGIVTNKPAWLTDKLINKLMKKQSFPSSPKIIISGDTLAEKKPHPAPLLMAADACNVDAKKCIYLGDHPRDIEAGKNAKMLTGAALFGFLPKNENASKWQADFNFATANEMADFLKEIK